MNEFKKICRQHKLKITPQRTAVYKELVNDKTHPTTDMIYRKVRVIFPSISFDTVNRTLISFAEIGLINAIECSGQGRKYDPDIRPHHHLKCTQCGGITDFYHQAFDNLKVPSRKLGAFKVTNKKVVLTGICPKCQLKGGK